MLTVRRDQLLVLEEANRRAFCETTIDFIRQRYPQAAEPFGEEGVRAMVLQAMRKARAYKLTEHAHILRYINVMYTLGCDFDRDPDYPWAREILEHPRLRAGSKLDLLAARTLEYLRARERRA